MKTKVKLEKGKFVTRSQLATKGSTLSYKERVRRAGASRKTGAKVELDFQNGWYATVREV